MAELKKEKASLENAEKLVTYQKFNAAFKEFGKILKRWPKFAEAYNSFGNALTVYGRYPEAIEQFKKAIRLDPKTGFNQERLAIALYRIKERDEAVIEFQKIIDKIDDASAFNKWGCTLTGINRYSEAVEQFGNCIRKDPDFEFDSNQLGKALASFDIKGEAIDSFQKDVDGLDNSNTYYHWAMTLREMGKYEQAIEQFKNALNKEKSPLIHFNLGRTYFINEHYKNAITEFQETLKLDKKHTDAHYFLGESYFQLKDYAAAIKKYKRAIGLKPGKESNKTIICSSWRRSIENLEEPEKAFPEYQKASEKHADFEYSYIDWSETLASLGYYELAVDQYHLALRKEPQNQYVYESIGKFLDKFGYEEKALSSFEQTLNHINDGYSFFLWGQTLVSLHEYEKAIEVFQIAVEKKSSHYELFYKLADTLAKIKQKEAKIKQLQKTIDDLGDLYFYDKWGEVLTSLGEYEKAVEHFQKVLGKKIIIFYVIVALSQIKQKEAKLKQIQKTIDNFDDPSFYQQWGMILDSLGKYKDAIKQYRKAVKKQPNFNDAHFNLGVALKNDGQYTKAIESFCMAAEIDSVAIRSYIGWAETLITIGSPGEAVEKYILAIEKSGCLDFSNTFDNLRRVLDKIKISGDIIKRFQQAVDNNDNPDCYIQWGKTLDKVGEYNLAIEQYKKVINNDPDNNTAYENWRDVLGKLNFPKKELEDYEKTIDTNFNNADAYLELGNVFFNHRKYDDSIKYYKKGLEKNTKSAFAYIKCSLSYHYKGLYEIAMEYAEKALEIEPHYADAYNILGLSLAGLKQYNEAINQYQTAIKFYTNKTHKKYPYKYWAMVLQELGAYDEAISNFEKAIECDERDHETYFNIGNFFLDIDRYEEALIQFQRSIEKKTDYTYAYHNIAHILWKQGKYKDSREKWKEVVSLYEESEKEARESSNADHFRYFASILREIFGDIDRSITIMEEGRKIDPRDSHILLGLIYLYLEKIDMCPGISEEDHKVRTSTHSKMQELYKRAEPIIKDKIDRNEDNIFALLELGELYLVMENYKEAEKFLLNAVEKDDKNAQLQNKLGDLYFRKKVYKKAIYHYEIASKLDPSNLSYRSELASAYHKIKMNDKAETEYNKILAITPYHIESLIGLGEVYLSMAENEDSDKYADSISNFTKALKVSTDEENRSKHLNRKELAAIHYSRGYAKLKLYESSTLGRNEDLIKEALDDFKKCHDIDPCHLKAKRAEEKIKEKIQPFSSYRITEKIGPWAVFIPSLFIFIAVQVSFFLYPLSSKPYCSISQQSIKKLQNKVPESILKNLDLIKNEKFDSPGLLLEKLSTIETITLSDNLKELILKELTKGKDNEIFPEILTTSYTLITFASLIFMITGLYLPQVLKLKVGAIELEKSSVEQVSAPRTFGINYT